MRLTQQDYILLERSFIPRALADAAGICRVDSDEGATRMGRKDKINNYAGLLFPYCTPGTSRVIQERLRLDCPEVDHATGKPKNRYLTAYASRNRAYFPPLPDDSIVKNKRIPAIVTEGEKKVLALWNYATNGLTTPPMFLPVGLAGVWSFRGVIGIAVNSHGLRVPQKGIIPDISLIDWTGRHTTILFDSNVLINPSVTAARWSLAQELSTNHAAAVWFVDLPASPGINGIDDFLFHHGTAAFDDLLKQAYIYDWKNQLMKTDKGKVVPCFENAITTLRSSPDWAGTIAYNQYAQRIVVLRDTPIGQPLAWQDHHTTKTTAWCERHAMFYPRRIVQDAIEVIANDHTFQPVLDYLEGLEWDRIERLDHWLTLYMGAEATDLTRAISARWMISAVARAYDPGCQVDHILILESTQGRGKSTAFRILGGDFFSDDIGELGTKDASLAAGKAWIIELAELDAMTRAEVSKIKAFVTRRIDHFRPPYGRNFVDVPRSSVFCGTVNPGSKYLKDETGGRRFWPVACGNVLRLEDLARDRDQLWAEAVARYKKGEKWWLTETPLIEAVEEEQEERYLADPWEPLIQTWLLDKTEATTAEVLASCIHKDMGQWTRADETRVGIILHRQGWETSRPYQRGGGPRRRIYRPKQEEK
jgi:predicted P-loop ATPase